MVEFLGVSWFCGFVGGLVGGSWVVFFFRKRVFWGFYVLLLVVLGFLSGAGWGGLLAQGLGFLGELFVVFVAVGVCDWRGIVVGWVQLLWVRWCGCFVLLVVFGLTVFFFFLFGVRFCGVVLFANCGVVFFCWCGGLLDCGLGGFLSVLVCFSLGWVGLFGGH